MPASGPILSSRSMPRSLRRVLPWLFPFGASVALHIIAAVVIGTFVLGAYVLRHSRSEPLRPIAVDFYDAGGQPLSPRQDTPPPQPTVGEQPASFAPSQPSEAFVQRIDSQLERRIGSGGLDGRLDRALGDRLGGSVPSLSFAPQGPAVTPPSVAFVGLKAPAASVVYVVDASGSLLSTFPTVLAELARSLGNLDPVQRFSIVFFQRNSSLPLPPDGGLRSATADAVGEAVAWSRRSVRPSGRSNPLAALQDALAKKPDLIFLLSTDITGSGEFEISRDELLTRLDLLNPRDGSGARRTRIQCVQFLDADPLDTLRLIAEQHGGGNGFRFLSREELGLEPRR